MGKLFVVAKFPSGNDSYFTDLQNQLRSQGISGEFQPEGDFHVTLFFYGDLDDIEIEDIADKINEKVKGVDQLEFTTDKIKEFNNDGKRVIWMGVRPEDGLRKLNKLLGEIKPSDSKFKYQPHITLVNNASKDEYEKLQFEPHKITCSSIQLTKSVGEEENKEHVLVREYHLGLDKQSKLSSRIASRLKKKFIFVDC